MRFHILGLGPIGNLVAHHLRSVLPRNHEITLIHRTRRLARKERQNEGEIRIENCGVISTSTGYDSEVFDEEEATRAPTKGYGESSDFIGMPQGPPQMHGLAPLQHIESLIITTKAQSTLPALTKLLPRLSGNSTIVLLQNGLGVYEQLIQELFRNPESRPHFIVTANTHGAWLKNYSQVVHAAVGQIEFGIVPDPLQRDFEAAMKDEDVPIHDRQLHINDITPLTDDPQLSRYRSLRLTVAALSAMEALDAKWQPIRDVQVAMRRKLVANAVINPLTALMGCRNGDIFTQKASLRIASRICAEAAAAFERELIHATQSMLEGVGDAYNQRQLPVGRIPRLLEQGALQKECLRVAKATKGNVSSMLADLRKGRPTEIDYLNGYLLHLGNAYQIPMPANAMLLNLIKMRSAIPLDQML